MSKLEAAIWQRRRKAWGKLSAAVLAVAKPNTTSIINVRLGGQPPMITQEGDEHRFGFVEVGYDWLEAQGLTVDGLSKEMIISPEELAREQIANLR